ncbi:hypothetical protein Phi17218_187 [Cellulophaga phage phi17:2_18]|uniref:Uncharacterized protein n=2 Tax=Lightbulbvirus Cba172 TaxID=1918525 RepID=R9ZYW2_9CAUD|nr:hypothetical protein Phi17:2_gp187 [Cellulophaga phage phi17:2]AGO47720.1 hypothetical protein Phi17:2_gp187 [Cellulophaga phage phi17:2]ALO80590.1 hypothetical protein Phi17218_187 [Cellulophaga phage phi17:2_18]
MEYKNKKTKKVVVVSNMTAAGVCHKTIGMTLVVFKSKDEEVTKVMENENFHTRYCAVSDENKPL